MGGQKGTQRRQKGARKEKERKVESVNVLAPKCFKTEISGNSLPLPPTTLLLFCCFFFSSSSSSSHPQEHNSF